MYKLKRLDEFRWEIPSSYKPGMRTSGLIYASEDMLEQMKEEQVLEQVANVAFLPGIVGYSLAMPDIHWGYGFPIGGVAGTKVEDGVISPGGVGFDINCGVRLLKTSLTFSEVAPRMEELMTELFRRIPSGLGSEGRIRVGEKEMGEVLTCGTSWAVERGLGKREDLELCEEQGCMKGADLSKVSDKAKKRGIPQLGTLGSGNHFLEVEAVEEIYDRKVAKAFGIEEVGQILVLIHTGSRGLGHQICTDYVRLMGEAVSEFHIELPDRQLACAPLSSTYGKDYLSAMKCAANYAWANRQCITHFTRECFTQVFGAVNLDLVYDVAHNIAKIETHTVDGKKLSLCVHRKGATRAFPSHHPDLPSRYKDVGQPVLIPGDMGRYSYVAIGTERALSETFGSTCHGAGRLKSRGEAKRELKGKEVASGLAARGIIVKTGNISSLSEEASPAYKDVAQVMDIVDRAGISRKVTRSRPVGVVKG
jgi:tRNA-splicing ligase RtcB